MSLAGGLAAREASGRPVGVALIGAGAFGRMVLHQAVRTRGLVVRVVADRDVGRAHAALALAGAEQGSVAVTADAEEAIALAGVEVVVEATGDAAAGARHALLAAAHGRHVVMVTVEADALVGPLLARRCREAGVVYSLVYGDQPALICELVDWARTSGFEVECAGKGTRYLPAFHEATPDTVWGHYGLDPQRVREAGFDARMFTTFLDGTKSAIEMAAVANATGLAVPDGLGFPPAAVDELPTVCRPRSAGGELPLGGAVEVVSDLRRDGAPVERDLRWGVFVVVRAGTAAVRGWFADYGLVTSPDGEHAALWRPSHLIGLEAGVSIASVALRGEATGAPDALRADVVAVAKRDLPAATVLDGEGGTDVWGRLVPAARSLRDGGLPIALAGGAVLARPLRAGDEVRLGDLASPPVGELAALRQELVDG